jgi:hypothetical protein
MILENGAVWYQTLGTWIVETALWAVLV